MENSDFKSVRSYSVLIDTKDFRNSTVCAVTPDVFRSICLS